MPSRVTQSRKPARVAGIRSGTVSYWTLPTAGFEVLLTTDRNIRYQQNLTGRKIAIVVLDNGRWRLIKKRLSEIAAAVAAATPGSFAEVEIPVD